MKSDGTWVKAVHQNEDTSSGVKTFTFDDDYNIEIMFQNGLSNEQKSNFKFKEENNYEKMGLQNLWLCLYW